MATDTTQPGETLPESRPEFDDIATLEALGEISIAEEQLSAALSDANNRARRAIVGRAIFIETARIDKILYPVQGQVKPVDPHTIGASSTISDTPTVVERVDMAARGAGAQVFETLLSVSVDVPGNIHAGRFAKLDAFIWLSDCTFKFVKEPEEQ